MKVIDFSAAGKAEEKSGFLSKIGHILPVGNDQVDNSALAAVTAALHRVLDNQNVLLQQIQLEGLDVPIPMILVGPSGIWVILGSSTKGVYRAKEDTWELLDERTQRYQVSKPNLLTRVQLMARAVDTYLVSRNLKTSRVEPVLILTDPGIHVDAVRPIVRVVMVDAIDRFTTSLAQDIVHLDRESVQRVVTVLTGDKLTAATTKSVEEVRDAFSFLDVPADRVATPAPNVLYDRSEAPIFKKVPFTKRHLVVLSLLVLVNILILGIFVVFILMTS